MQKQRFFALRQELKQSFFQPSPKRELEDPFLMVSQGQIDINLIISGSEEDTASPEKSLTGQYISTSSEKIPHLTTPQKKNKKGSSQLEFGQIYDLQDTIGQGGHAVVKRCVKKIIDEIPNEQQQYAVKIFRSGDPEIINTIRKTFNINIILKHENICQALELYIDERREQCFYVQEYCSWPSLEQVLLEKKQLSLGEAKNFMTELFQTIYYIHMKGIAHRDIKPDNILVNFTDEYNKFQYQNFGVSKQFYIQKTKTVADMWTRTGNIFYQPPESFLGGGYNEKIDTWSTGVVLYQIITGYLPFECDTIIDTIELIQKAQLDQAYIQNIPKLVLDLLKRVLHQDPAQRLSARESLIHPWIQSDIQSQNSQYLLKPMSKDDASLIFIPSPDSLAKHSSDGVYLTPDLRKTRNNQYIKQNLSKFAQQFCLDTNIHHIEKEIPQKSRFRAFSLNNIAIEVPYSPPSNIQAQWLTNGEMMESPPVIRQESI